MQAPQSLQAHHHRQVWPPFPLGWCATERLRSWMIKCWWTPQPENLILNAYIWWVGGRLSPQSLACCRCSPMWYLAMWATRAPSFHCSSLVLMQISSTLSNFPITQALPSLLFRARRNSLITIGSGYPTWQGEKLTGEQLGKLVQGLKANNLICYSHLLTGEPPLSHRHISFFLTCTCFICRLCGQSIPLEDNASTLWNH